ncbi:MAG TPA: fibronectin type III domain-containing protein [Trebonia sp.]|nr:fibronectin type III domain-containing protein [Trebonia sp.]
MIVGLLVWQPWNPPPNAPTAVHVTSPTATTAAVAWTAAKGGGKPGQYLIYRDGKQAGTVSGTATSWTDSGLVPGSTHQYAVTASGGGGQSAQSTKASVTTITPPPVKLAVSKPSYTTFLVTWAPSPQAPTPDGYTIYVGGSAQGSVAGSVTSYTFSHLTAGDQYQVSVTARWGGATSAPSANLAAATLHPPLSGSVPLTWKVTSTPGSGSWGSVGEHWTDTWNFTAACTTSCTLTDDGEFAPPDLSVRPFTMRLTPASGGYSGTTTAEVTQCGSIHTHNTISVHVAPKSGAVANGAWTAWTGTVQLSSPYQAASSTTYCPAQSWHFTLTGNGS